MPLPNDYNFATMSVEPGPINFGSDMINDSVQSIVDALNAINGALSDLKLGWAGQTAAEARDFSDQWKNAMTGLFGSGSGGQSGAPHGVMNQVIVALRTASGNFSNAEIAITQMFKQLSGGLASSNAADTDPIPAGPTVYDPSQTAVAEINWTPLS